MTLLSALLLEKLPCPLQKTMSAFIRVGFSVKQEKGKKEKQQMTVFKGSGSVWSKRMKRTKNLQIMQTNLGFHIKRRENEKVKK